MKNLNKQQIKDDINTTNIITTTTTTALINNNNTNNLNINKQNNINTKDLLQFKCQLCGLLSESQLDFFAHLKSHYEPTINEENSIQDNNEINNINIQQSQQQPVIIFNDNNNKDKLENINNQNSINNGKTALTKQYNTKNKRKKNLINNNLKKNSNNNNDDDNKNNCNNNNNNNIDLLNIPIEIPITTTQTILPLKEDINIIDNMHARIILPTMTSITSPTVTKIDTMLEEFSEPEDMLEGIRNVVENVQDTIDDTTQLDQFLMNN